MFYIGKFRVRLWLPTVHITLNAIRPAGRLPTSMLQAFNVGDQPATGIDDIFDIADRLLGRRFDSLS